jgi:hypothetical protein
MYQQQQQQKALLEIPGSSLGENRVLKALENHEEAEPDVLSRCGLTLQPNSEVTSVLKLLSAISAAMGQKLLIREPSATVRIYYKLMLRALRCRLLRVPYSRNRVCITLCRLRLLAGE